MRTAVTLDADVAARLEQVARERGVSLEQALDQAVRDGLDASRGRAGRFRQDTRPMGLRPGVPIAKALQLAARLEDETAIRQLGRRGQRRATQG